MTSQQNTYDIGDEIVLQGTFEDLTGDVEDPTSVACRVKSPDGTITTLSASKVSTGVYTASFGPSIEGVHWYRFEGTGAVTAAGERSFIVRIQQVPVA
jgi:hypothetical protein